MLIISASVVVAVLATLGSVECEAAQVAGKCHPICMDPVPIDFSGFANMGNWDVLYASNIPEFLDIDEGRLDATPIVNDIFRVDRTFGNSSNSASRDVYVVSYSDNVVIEDAVDEKGERHQFRVYPLAVTKENALYFYRCSDSGQDNIDTRYIVIPKGVECSKEALDYLLAIDKKCNFKGKLKKLPKRSSK